MLFWGKYKRKKIITPTVSILLRIKHEDDFHYSNQYLKRYLLCTIDNAIAWIETEDDHILFQVVIGLNLIGVFLYSFIFEKRHVCHDHEVIFKALRCERNRLVAMLHTP